MVGTSFRLCRRVSSPLIRPCRISSRALTSATSRSTAPTTARLPRSTSLPTSPSRVPDLCLGAGGKAPGFVQQMLFSSPVQEKNAKEQINQSIRVLLGDNISTNGNAPNVENKPSSLPPSPFKY